MRTRCVGFLGILWLKLLVLFLPPFIFRTWFSHWEFWINSFFFQLQNGSGDLFSANHRAGMRLGFLKKSLHLPEIYRRVWTAFLYLLIVYEIVQTKISQRKCNRPKDVEELMDQLVRLSLSLVEKNFKLLELYYQIDKGNTCLQPN